MSDSRERHRRVSELFARWHDVDPTDRETWWRERIAEEPTEVIEAVHDLLRLDRSTFPELDLLIAEIKNFRSPPLPERIGPFRILGKLGSGGMGVVYEAEQIGLGRRVALKVLRSAMAGEGLVRRFMAEAKTLALLDHPGIARLYDAGLDVGEGQVPWIAMELVAGTTLDQYVRAESPDRAARIALLAAVCDAVEHAHQRGIVHRDLKPSNVLVQKDGSVKVLDFGIARLLDQDHTAALTTDPGQVLGTIAYMSPEQAAGDSARVGPPSDVYALGVMLHELLSGSRPIDFSGASLTEALRRIQTMSPTRLGALDPTLRGDLEVITSKALEKDIEPRFPTASGLAADLRRFLRDEPILSRPPSTWRSVRSFARRHRALVAASAFAAVALATATAVSLTFAFRAEDARRDAEVLSGQEFAARRSAEAASLRATEEARIARAEADTTEALLDFVRAGLLELDPMKATSAEPTLRDALTAMAKRVPLLEGKPFVRARMQAFLASILSGLGDYKTAAQLIVPALEVLEAEESSPSALGDALRNSAWIHQRLGDRKRAARDANAAIAVAERAGQELADFRSNMQVLLGEIFKDSGQTQEARACFEAALHDLNARNSKDRPTIALCHMSLGLLFMNERDFKTALYHGEQSLLLREQVYGDKHAYVAESLHNLATIKVRSGDLSAAIRDAIRARDIRSEVMRPDHPAVFAGYRLLFSLYSANDQAAEALQVIDTIPPEVTAHLKPDSESRRSLIFNRALCLFNLGQHEAAWAAFELATKPDERRDIEQVEFLYACYLNWGDSVYRARQFDGAVRTFARLIALLERVPNAAQSELIQPLVSRSASYSHLGDEERARQDLERALSIAKADGPNSRAVDSLADASVFLSSVDVEWGDFEAGMRRSDWIIAELRRFGRADLEGKAIQQRLAHSELEAIDSERSKLEARLAELQRPKGAP